MQKCTKLHKNKLFVSATEWLRWLHTSSGYKRFTLVGD